MTNSYEIPHLLKEIITWEEEIKQEVPYLETPTGYFLQFDPHDNGGYMSSPVDAIMFARTGMGGIHFSFLTDFGNVTDLSVVPIVRVDPMASGSYARIVARNIRDFFAFGFSGHEGLLLNEFESKQQYLDYVNEQEDNTSESEYFDKKKWDREQQKVRDLAVQRFGFQLIHDGYSYSEEVRRTRRNEVILDTLDGLGVGVKDALVDYSKRAVPHPWHEKEISYDQDEQLISYISSAEQVGLFSLLRDVQAQGFDNSDVFRAIHNRLVSLGLSVEEQMLARYLHKLY